MTKFVIFGSSTEEEAHLAHIEIETFQASITKTNNRILFANVTLRLSQEVQNFKQRTGRLFHSTLT